jgi:hypothetical protein
VVEDGFEGLAAGVEGSWRHAPEQGFDLGDSLLDRVEVGRVRREKEQPHPGRFEAFTHARNLVRGQIVGNDDAAGRPPMRPRARAAAKPAWVRSAISSRSNSAQAAKMPKASRPLAVAVSICAPAPASTLRPMPRTRRSSAG